MSEHTPEELFNIVTNLLCACTQTEDGESNPCPTCQYYKDEIEKVAQYIYDYHAKLIAENKHLKEGLSEAIKFLNEIRNVTLPKDLWGRGDDETLAQLEALNESE